MLTRPESRCRVAPWHRLSACAGHRRRWPTPARPLARRQAARAPRARSRSANTNGSSTGSHPQSLAQAGLLLALGDHAVVLGERGAERSAGQGRRRPRTRPLEQAGLAGVEALRVERVDDHARRAAGRSRTSSSRSDSVSLTGISSAVATATTPVNSAVGDRVGDRAALVGDRTDARDLGERARRAQDADAVSGRRRIDDHEVIRRGTASPALELRELPNLADAEQLAHSGRGHRENGEQPARRRAVVRVDRA